MQFNLPDSLKGKRIALAPYNELTICLSETLVSENCNVVGFFDSYKQGEHIVSAGSESGFDKVLVISPRYWREIVKGFESDRVMLYLAAPDTFVSLSDYQAEMAKSQQYDVLLLGFNRSQCTDLSLVSRELLELGLTSAIVDPGLGPMADVSEGIRQNKDIPVIHKDALLHTDYTAILASIDWDEGYGKQFIQEAREQGKLTIGIVDGIEDFSDTDYGYDRQAYQRVEYVLTMGEDDQACLSNKIEKATVVGLPKLHAMFKEEPVFPEQDIALINVNFTYDSFEECRESWVAMVVQACRELDLAFTVSQHPADNGDLTGLPVTNLSVYESVRRATLVISRFSTVVLEALVLGKPVVYFNPHGEKVPIYQGGHTPLYQSENVSELKRAIVKALAEKLTARHNATTFLDRKCNVLGPVPPAKLAAYRIDNLINLRDNLEFHKWEDAALPPRYVQNKTAVLPPLSAETISFCQRALLKKISVGETDDPRIVSAIYASFNTQEAGTYSDGFMTQEINGDTIGIGILELERCASLDSMMARVTATCSAACFVFVDRSRKYEIDHPAQLGPPTDMSLRREWSADELSRLLSESFSSVEIEMLTTPFSLARCFQKG